MIARAAPFIVFVVALLLAIGPASAQSMGGANPALVPGLAAAGANPALVPGLTAPQPTTAAPALVPGPPAGNQVENDAPLALPQSTEPGPTAPGQAAIDPFGAQLFTSLSHAVRPPTTNANYLVSPGDQISVQAWGALSYNGVQMVDPQGNIFLPEVGPVHVGGLPASSLNQAIESGVHRVFTGAFSIYSNVMSKQPVSVFVTGAVSAPGRYSDDSSTSVLNLLQAAGGISKTSGSYRDIRILRRGKPVVTVDLYDFLLAGRVPTPLFQENDTIVVGPQRPCVIAQGDIQNSYRFEVRPGHDTGADILALARPLPAASHVTVTGVRGNKPVNRYMTLKEFATLPVADGDLYNFQSDRVNETMFVNIIGQSSGPSSFVVPRNARIGELLRLIEVDPARADIKSIYLRRLSVADQQNRALSMALSQLHRAVLTARTETSTDAVFRAQEAQMVERFVDSARQVKSEGRVVLAGAADPSNVTLEPGDTVVIPVKSDVVSVSGEVRLPQSVIWQPGSGASDYVERSGGFTDRADTGKFVVLHQNGIAELGKSMEIRPGDLIMIMPDAETNSFAMFKDIVGIVYQLAVSSAVAVKVF
jgi:protein involved in polysaccharide export with SLBB domain